jgi:hypothetical protein
MKAKLIGHILHSKCLLKHVTEEKMEGKPWWEDDEEDVRSYWMALRKGEDTGIWNRDQ